MKRRNAPGMQSSLPNLRIGTPASYEKRVPLNQMVGRERSFTSHSRQRPQARPRTGLSKQIPSLEAVRTLGRTQRRR